MGLYSRRKLKGREKLRIIWKDRERLEMTDKEKDDRQRER